MNYVVLLFIFLPSIAQADILITEIMYDLAEGSDTGREWIEVYNSGVTAIDLTSYKVVENGKNHALKAGAGLFAAGTYAVIADNAAKFKTEYPNYSGTLYDSAFSLNNAGESIGIATAADALLDSVVFTDASANGTGDSLQRAPIPGGRFDAGTPTPGAPIPAGGLAKTPVVPKAGKASTKNLPATAAAPVLVGEVRSAQIETVELTPQSPEARAWYWWLAPVLLATTGSAGIVIARHYKKDEWDIVEEVGETS